MPKRKTHEQFLQEVYNLVGNEYTVLGKYKGAHIKGTRKKASIKMRHNKCGNTWFPKVSNFLYDRSRCPVCNGTRKPLKTHKEFINEVYSLAGDEYTVEESYVNAKTEIAFKHNKCSNTFMMTPHVFLLGSRCPYCNESKGEHIIREQLDKYGLNYNKQKSFDGCRYRRKLKFDFCVENKLLIEYDGVHHFKQVKSWGNDMSFDEIQIRSEIKDKFCIDKNIPLIRIPYWEINNIGYILKNALKFFDIIDGECEDEIIVNEYHVCKEWDKWGYENIVPHFKDIL